MSFNQKQNNIIPGKLNCIQPIRDNYPKLYEFLPFEIRIVLLCVIILVILLVVIELCSCYYVPAIETINYRFQLTNYTAGRAIMATVSSLPFLMDGTHNLFTKRKSVGFEMLLGLGQQKILLAIGLGCLLMPKKLYIDWWPMMNDFMWYCCGLIMLPLIFPNYVVFWYITLLIPLAGVVRFFMVIMDKYVKRGIKAPDERCYPCVRTKGELEQPQSDPTANETAFAKCPRCHCRNIHLIIVAILTFPFHMLFYFLIPNPYSKKFAKLFWLTIILCILFFIILSYILTWALVDLFLSWRVPDFYIYHYVAPFGISYVSIVSTVVAFSKGHAEMGISNAYGAAANDIFWGFGIVTLIETLSLKLKVLQHTHGILNLALTMIPLSFWPFALCWMTYFSVGRLNGYIVLSILVLYSVASFTFEFLFVKMPICKCDNK